MRIEQLQYLIEISHYRSLNLAAESLHISTQALSSSMKNLETELDTIILTRTNKGISLTEKGEAVLQYAQTTLKNYYDLIAYLQEPSQPIAAKEGGLSGNLVIHTSPVFLESILPHKIKEFKHFHPNIAVQIAQNTIPDIYSLIQSPEASQSALGMILLPCIQNTPIHTFLPSNDLFFKPISLNHYVCCVPKDSPYARYKTISIKKILEEPLVFYTAGSVTSSPLYCLLQQYSDKIQIASAVSSMTFWVKAINNHIGIGLLNELFVSPDSMVKELFKDLTFIKIKELLFTINGIVYAQENDLLVAAFIKQFPDYRPTKNELAICSECMIL